MKTVALVASAAFWLSACGSAETENASDPYVENFEEPVTDLNNGKAPVSDNDSIENGVDEQVDNEFSGENMPSADDNTQ